MCLLCASQVFDSLNAIELKSLEEPRYLLQQFVRDPGACLTLASFLATNAGDVARRHIKASALLLRDVLIFAPLG